MLWGALSTVVGFTGDTVRDNKDEAVKEHTSIREEVQTKDNSLRRELMGEIKLVQMKQEVMKDNMNKGFTEVLVAIEQLK